MRVVRKMGNLRPNAPLYRRTALAHVDAPVRDITPESLIRLADSQDRQGEASRGGSARVHVSALAGEWCPRRHAIQFRHPGAVAQFKSFRSADKIIHVIGRAVEHHVRTQLIAALGRTAVLGRWHCLCGAIERTGFGEADPQMCRRCQFPAFIYREMVLEPAAIPATGAVDFLFASGKVIWVMEIKSKALKLFDPLTAPEADHVVQGSHYREMLLHVTPPGYTVSPKIIIYYAAKDYPQPGKPVYKPFVVDPLPVAAVQQRLALDLGKILAGDTLAPLPPRLPVCTTSAVPRAKRCDSCTLCMTLPNIPRPDTTT